MPSAPSSMTRLPCKIEFASIPGKYAAPKGLILLAERDGAIEGVVSLKPVDPDICEMKRLYVRPRARGGRLEFQLVERLISEARSRIGCRRGAAPCSWCWSP